MEDNLKMLKLKYLCNLWLDLTKVLKLNRMTKPKFTNALNEDYLKISKWGHLSNPGRILLKFKRLYVSKPKFTSPSEKDDLHWKTISKY